MKEPRDTIKILFLLLCFLGEYPAISKAADSNEQIDILIQKAEEMLKTDPSKAIYYASSAIIEAQRINDKSGQAMAQALLGEAYMNQGDFDMGYEAITSALEKCPSDNTILSAFIYVHLANSYNKIKDFDAAFKYIEKALEIYEQANDLKNLARCYNSRGLVYIQVDDNVKAEKDFKTALALNRQLKLPAVVAANLNNLCLFEGDAKEKIALLQEAIAINKSLGTVWSLGENYNNLGTQYYYAGDYRKAMAALDTAMMYARKINAKELITDNYRYHSWVYEAENNYQQAYKCLLELYNMERELLAKDEIRQIELKNIQRRLQDKESQITMQEQTFQIKSLRMQSLIAILIAIAVAFILLYVTFRFRQQKKIQVLESDRKLKAQEKELIDMKLRQAENESIEVQKELDHNRQELINFAFFVRSRNDLLSNIQTMLKEGYKLSGSEIGMHLRSINAYISQFNAKNTETEILIDKVNGLFIDKLSTLHPDLSKNEQRLASLLRIGLSTKEIASVVDSTPKTVNMARYRLRKHLNLETDESLTEYMKSI